MRSRAALPLSARYRRSLWLLAGWVVAGCSGSHEPTHTLPTPPHASIAPTTNVPALLGKSIDGLRSRLGMTQLGSLTLSDPELESSLAIDNSDSLAAFRTGGLTVLASYNTHTRQVHDLLVLGHHEDSLMARASLQSSARNYLVMPVFLANKPNHLFGLRVINAK